MAAIIVANTYELLEIILCNTDVATLHRWRRVSTQFRGLVDASVRLQRKLRYVADEHRENISFPSLLPGGSRIESKHMRITPWSVYQSSRPLPAGGMPSSDGVVVSLRGTVDLHEMRKQRSGSWGDVVLTQPPRWRNGQSSHLYLKILGHAEEGRETCLTIPGIT